MKTRMHYLKKIKNKKIEQHEITKRQNKREWRKIYKKGKYLLLLEIDTNLGLTIAPKKVL